MYRLSALLLLIAFSAAAGCGEGERQPRRGEAGEAFAGVHGAVVLGGARDAPPAPVFNAVPCSTFDLTERSVATRCGYVSVPEDRSRPEGRTIELAVVVFASSSAEPDAIPLVWLEGGPGAPAIDTMKLMLTSAAGRQVLRGRDLLADRDLVVFDQRGTGRSKPALTCPELATFFNPVADPRAEQPGAMQGAIGGAVACRDRLRGEGIDLAAYTSSESAADVNDIRIALGHLQVNLYGSSYGTRLALTVLRDFPGIVRGAVLDSVFPPQVDLYAGILASGQRSFDLFFAACAGDARCRTAYPRLEDGFYELVARLNANPISFRLAPPLGRGSVQITGDRLVSTTFHLLYATQVYPLLPAMLSALRDGNATAFAIAAQQLQPGELISVGMYYSIQCGEESAFTDRAAVDAAARAVRPEVARALAPVLVDPLFAICPEWGARPALPRENEPVSSDAPVLLLAGAFDPVTPPAYAEIAARAMSNSYLFTFPATGHVALTAASPCPYEIAWAFLRDPHGRPDNSCIKEMKGPAWVTR